MSNRSSTRRSDTQPFNADAYLDLESTPPPPRKRTLNDDDDDYHLTVDAQGTSRKGETPKKRKVASSLASYAKRNVVQAVATVRGASVGDPAQCVVSRASEQRMVIEFSHVMSGSTPLDHMACFEWSWGMQYRSLNADTRLNVQTLGIDLHRLFDATKDSKPTGWFWIPTDDNLALLTVMHSEYVGGEAVTDKAGMTENKRCDLKDFYNKYKSTKFTYRLIPLPEMNESWSVRRYNGELHGPLHPDLIQNSIYPFSDLPNFELHIPYHFVIVNTGKKLFQICGLDKINFARDFPFLQGPQGSLTRTIMLILRNIYVAWTLAMPDRKWLTGEPYNDANQEPPIDHRRQGGTGSDSGGQGKGGPSGSKGGGTQARSMGGAAPSGGQIGRRRATAKSLTPWDSASCVEPLELVDGTQRRSDDEDEPFVDDEEEEYEDEEFFNGLKQWVANVWSATRRGTGSDSEGTMVGEAAGPAFSKGVDATTSPLTPLLSVL